MPRAFLFKKKRKTYFRSNLDPHDCQKKNLDLIQTPLQSAPVSALLPQTNGRVSDDFINFSFTVDKAENVTAPDCGTILNRVESEFLPKGDFTERSSSESSLLGKTTNKLENSQGWRDNNGSGNGTDKVKLFGDHEKELQLKFDDQKSESNEFSRYERATETSCLFGENKLRYYLESFDSRNSTTKGDTVVKVANPWAVDVSSNLLRRRREPGLTDPQAYLENLFSPDLSSKSERISPSPSEKWTAPFQEKTSADSTKEEKRVDATVLNSLYQSYLYSASYYNSLHSRAWRNAQLLRSNQLTYSDVDFKEPFSSSCRPSLFSSIAGYPSGFVDMLQIPTEKIKPSPSKTFLRVPPMGKSGARQPVPGVEYVKNTVDLEIPHPESGLATVADGRGDNDSGADGQYQGTSLNSYISGSSGLDIHVPSRKRGQTKERAVDRSDVIAGFTESTLKTILTPPAPQTYRGGRRSATGKPPQPRKYVCDVCGKAFSRSNTLVTHKRIHTGDKPFACELCGRAFRQPGNLTRHRLTHTTVKPYVCSQCGKAFNRASNLHTHMRTHTNYKPFVCQFCGKGFHQKIDMKIHSYTHTGEKPHKCKKCGRGFKQLTHLTYHMRTHSEVKMYTCNYCGKGFNQKGNLQAHIYRHTGERPHQCDICNKGFTLASTLNTHRRTHAEKKPYVCQYCGKDFYQKSALRSHLVASHPYSGGDSLL